MKRKITLKETAVREIEQEVEFPIYRAHHLTSDGDGENVLYMRVDENCCLVSISVYRGQSGVTSYTLSIEPNYHFDRSPLDYLLGRGQYASSREEFDKALADLRAALHAI